LEPGNGEETGMNKPVVMSKPVVVYTDPAWAITNDGSSDISRATIEQDIFRDRAVLKIAKASDGKYSKSGPAFAETVRGADAIAIYRQQVTRELLEIAGPSLKVVARQGVGFDNLNPSLLKQNGIVGFNVPDYCVDEVAAHTLALTLAWERGVIGQHVGLVGGRFNIYEGGAPRRLRDCVAGIVGFGRIGRVVAARLRDFYGRVLAYDPYVERDLMIAHGVTKVDFKRLLETSDLISLHCLLNEETTGIIGDEAFASMKPSALLVNAARGALIDRRALRDALARGAIAGAAIDVFTPEDPNEDEVYRDILRMKNVVVTSHRAFLSVEAEASQRRRVAEGILAVLEEGRVPTVGHLTEGASFRWEAAIGSPVADAVRL
jgi:D-3-phosphoglycerate dehydrogenase